MIFSRLLRDRRNEVSIRHMGAVLLIALILGCLPTRASLALKDCGRLLLAPGQQVAQSALARLAFWSRAWHVRADSAEELRNLRRRVARLEDQNAVLRFGLRQPDGADSVEQPASLLATRPVEARVLGERAQAYLGSAAVMATPQSGDLTPGSLVVDSGTAIIDQGENAELSAGNMALAGGRIWGSLIQVGPQTSLVRRIDCSGYRGLVQIARVTEEACKPLARGVLEGTGERLCRIRMVDATAPISVGDVVVAAGEQGLIDSPLVYGRIERAELPAGAAHWQIWMAPAVDFELPVKLTILQPVVNRARKIAGARPLPAAME